MSISTKIALRYLRAGKRHQYFSWIATLSVVGVGISVATMIVVLSVINGFETEMSARFLNANAHILAFRYPDGLKDPKQWADTIQGDFGHELTGISPFVHYETMIRKDSIMHSILVRGFAPRERETVQSLLSSVQPASALDELQAEEDMLRSGQKLKDDPALIVAEGVLKILGLKVGDRVDIISPGANDASRYVRFRIVGAYHSGLKHYDNRLTAMALAQAQIFFQMGSRVTGLEIGLKEPNKSPAIAEAMNQKYTLSIKEWQSFNENLFQTLRTERVVIGAIVFIVAIVAGFNILTTLFVAVTQKQKEISILKSLGASNRMIMGIFLKQGIIFGVFGCILGCILAVGISKLIETYKFIDLPDPYYLTNLPIEYDPRVYGLITIVSVLICILAGIFPSVTAAHVKPSEGISGTGKAF